MNIYILLIQSKKKPSYETSLVREHHILSALPKMFYIASNIAFKMSMRVGENNKRSYITVKTINTIRHL